MVDLEKASFLCMSCRNKNNKPTMCKVEDVSVKKRKMKKRNQYFYLASGQCKKCGTKCYKIVDEKTYLQYK